MNWQHNMVAWGCHGLTCQVRVRIIQRLSGEARDWTWDLPIYRREPYHWATSPTHSFYMYLIFNMPPASEILMSRDHRGTFHHSWLSQLVHSIFPQGPREISTTQVSTHWSTCQQFNWPLPYHLFVSSIYPVFHSLFSSIPVFNQFML